MFIPSTLSTGKSGVCVRCTWEAVSPRKAWKMKVKSLSRVWLFATPWTVACQAPPPMGFSRQEYWSGSLFPSQGDLPDPGIEPWSPTLQIDALLSEPPGKAWQCPNLSHSRDRASLPVAVFTWAPFLHLSEDGSPEPRNLNCGHWQPGTQTCCHVKCLPWVQLEGLYGYPQPP